MSQENVEVVRGLIEAWNEGDRTKALELYDERMVFDTRGMDAGFPELSGVYVGLEEIQLAWREWLSAWQDIRAEPIWIEAAGDRVIVWVRQSQIGRDSAVPLEVKYAWDFLFRAGKLVRVAFFRDEREALRSAGLSE